MLLPMAYYSTCSTAWQLLIDAAAVEHQNVLGGSLSHLPACAGALVCLLKRYWCYGCVEHAAAGNCYMIYNLQAIAVCTITRPIMTRYLSDYTRSHVQLLTRKLFVITLRVQAQSSV
jgi:hypothetical protein